MKFVIFIGQHKVGSTSLQLSLARNYVRLLKAGILYPTIHNPDLRRDMKTFAARHLGLTPVPMAVWEAHNALAHQMTYEAAGMPIPPWHSNLPSVDEIFDNISAQIRRHDPHTVVICSETMSTFAGIEPRMIARLAQFTKGHEVQIMCTLRRPDEYIVSWHGQRMKIGERVLPMRYALSDYLDTVHLDYRLMLDGWRRYFKEAEFSCDSYSNVLGRGGSIPDFWHRTGLSAPEGMVPPRKTNPSIPLAALEIVRRCNHMLPKDTASALCHWVIRKSHELGAEKNRNVEILGAENRERLWEHFAPVSTYLDTFRAPFFEDLEDVTKPRPVPGREAARKLLPRLREMARARPPHKDIPDFLEATNIG